MQLTLDGIGMIPGLGEAADIANGFVSLGRGQWVDAGLSFLSAIPIFGYGATAMKLGRKVDKISGVYENVMETGEYVGQSKDIIKRTYQHFKSSKGTFKKETLVSQKLHKMPGSSSLEREIYEQYLILSKGGIDFLKNKKNPMGGRYDVVSKEGIANFQKFAQQVIKKYNLPE